MAKQILSFHGEQARRGAYARADRGIRTIEVTDINGSVGRATDFDERFRYRRGKTTLETESRLRRLRALFEAGGVPPLELYQIGDDLFVLDGHHRVALARRLEQDYLDAHVVEYLPNRDDPANAVYYERLAFANATGLRDVHATELGRYPRLLSRVRDHRHELAGRPSAAPRDESLVFPPMVALAERPPDLRQAARDWYEREYLPVVEVLAAERVVVVFPGRAMGDLYGYICDHRWYLSERRGWDVGIDAALLDFVHRHAPDQPGEELLDPINALGAELLDTVQAPGIAAGRWSAPPPAVFAVGLLALPIAFLRGLRPWHYRFPRTYGG